jgi:hypothetical protein
VARQSLLGRDQEGEHAQEDRHRRQEAQVTPVRGDDRHVAPAQRAELAEPVAALGRLDRRLRRPGHRGGRVHLVGDVALVVGRPAVVGGPVAVGLGLEGLEHLGPARLAEVAQALLGRPEVGDLAPGHQDQEAVAQVQVGHAVGHHDDRAAVMGQLGHLLHDRLVQARIQPGGRLVQVQQRRLGQQLEGHVDPLLLAAGHGRDARLGVPGQRQLLQDLGDPALALALAGVGREPELGCEAERAIGRELGVQDVVLRNQPDPVPQLGVVGVEIAVVVQDAAAVGRGHPGERPEQRGLAGAARADHAEQAALAEREAHVVQQHPPAGQRHCQLAGRQRDIAGVDELLQFVPDELERGGPDADDVDLGHRRRGDPLAVEVGAVVAAEVDDLVAAAQAPAQLGVIPGHAQVGHDHVVVRRPADPQHGGAHAHHGARRPVRDHRAHRAHGPSRCLRQRRPGLSRPVPLLLLGRLLLLLGRRRLLRLAPLLLGRLGLLLRLAPLLLRRPGLLPGLLLRRLARRLLLRGCLLRRAVLGRRLVLRRGRRWPGRRWRGRRLGIVGDRRPVPGRRRRAERARHGGPVLRMAEPDHAVPGDRDLLDALRSEEDPVGAARVLQQPPARVAPEHGMEPRDPRVHDDNV